MNIKSLVFYVEIKFISLWEKHSFILWIADEKTNSNFIPLCDESHLFPVNFWMYLISFSIPVHET